MSQPSFDSPRPDIQGQAEIKQLVDTFYEEVGRDDLLGPIFNDIAGTDWATHLPKMYAFWESMIFRSGGYRGDPLAVHARLVSLTSMDRSQFERWLQLFTTTVDELFSGMNAEHIKNSAADMANVIHARINGLTPDRLNPIGGVSPRPSATPSGDHGIVRHSPPARSHPDTPASGS